MTVLAIDQGTSGTKAIIVDGAGSVLSIEEVEVRPDYLPGGGVEQDPAALLDSVLEAGRRAVSAAGDPPVRAVALANQGETVLAWDPETGAPLSRAIVWQDRRAATICAGMAAYEDAIARRTGLVLDPYFSAPKMAWLRQNATTEGVITTTDTWIVHQLTGQFVTDASTASRSLLLDLDSVAWDEELLTMFNLQDEAMPRIVASDEIVGTTTAFGSEAPMAGLIVDQQAALFAQSCLTPGSAKCTYGTGAFLLANTGTTAHRSTKGLTTSVAWSARGTTSYCLDGQVYTAGSAIRWLTDLGLLAGPSALDATVAKDSGGVMFVPALAGLGAPWWRSQARAAFTGMSLSSRPGHLVKAVAEGVAAQVAELIDVVGSDLGQAPATLRVDGGLAHSSALMQAQADLSQIPVEVYPSTNATALGCAAMARLAVDPEQSVGDAIAPWTPSVTYEPRWSADRAADHRDRWRHAVDAMSGAQAPRMENPQ